MFLKVILCKKVTSRISLILEPPFPINDPHCVAGTINLIVIGGFGTLFGRACKSLI